MSKENYWKKLMNIKTTNEYEILTNRGFENFTGIKQVVSDNNLVFYFTDGSSIQVTYNHRFLVGRSKAGKIYRQAKNIKPSNKIDGKRILNIETIDSDDFYYDLIDVEGHDYITSNVTSHNCDEFAFIDPTKIKGFLDSVMPALSSSKKTKIVIISTPNGYNHFHKYWKDAEEGVNGYRPFGVTWEQVPGRDEEWKKQQIDDDGPLAFAQNHSCSFLGSSSTLLSPESLAELSKKRPLEEDFLGIPNFKLYEDYDPRFTYIISIDSSKTVGKLDAHNDYISIHALKLDTINRKITQAGAYRTNEIHYREIADVAMEIGEYFGHSIIVVENNEGAGTHAAERLMEEYDNVYFDPSHGGEVPGIRTTKKTKAVGLGNMRKLIEDGILDVLDSKTIDEFFTFIKIGKSYAASNGETDDCIMSLSTGLLLLEDIANPTGITIDDFLVRSHRGEEVEDESLDFTHLLYGNGTSMEDMKWLLGVGKLGEGVDK